MKILRNILTIVIAAFFAFGNVSFAKDKIPTIISVDMPAMHISGPGYFSCIILNHTGRELKGVNIVFHKYIENEQMWEIDETGPYMGLLANGEFYRDDKLASYDTVYCRFTYLGFDDDKVSLSMCYLDYPNSNPVTCFSN